MRRMLVLGLVFSLFLAGCQAPFSKKETTLAERETVAFDPFVVPETFIPKRVNVLGLGDSLTQGVGDERKEGGYFGRLTSDMEQWKGVMEVDAVNLAKRGRRSDQFLKQLQDEEVQEAVIQADYIVFTIGGNDIMKVVKGNFMQMKMSDFYKALGKFETRIEELFEIIRLYNPDAPIIVAGLYNPFSVVTDEVQEFEDIIADWNRSIEEQVEQDGMACFVPVKDLFNSNENLVYHTDFFHPNSKGYDLMEKRFVREIKGCSAVDLEVE
ncbi:MULTISPECIES: SGNH/GDSL hydrolase family protein [Sporosarcina]|uniref:GDSL family lipase n=1 Tax=Sporosarcina ureae TaxID=1571 RepID=A0ABM6JSD9_SPOUR|nr:MULTISPECIES: SGNH/GDSL hydrolase family protein [Sporosarcina]ARF12897.1 GDSL family lipase [Sporosarcina ureae]PIC77524.1 GDSL family lipase [Sporosarcina sp. P19]